MFTLADAQKAGWTVKADSAAASGQKGDVVVDVTSSIPLFSLLANIAEREGAGFAAGYGGTQPVTADLVQQTSGETYAEPPAPQPSLAERQRAIVGLKMKRDRFLAQTDWILLPSGSLPTDLPAQLVSDINANLAAWKTYRQQLRDYPSTVTDPLNPPPFPAQPTAPPFLLS